MVELTIAEGHRDAFHAVAREMIGGTSKEPGALGYNWYLRRDGMVCRIVETYANADALLAHLNGPVVQQMIPRLLEHATVDRSEVYGDAGAKATEILSRFGTQVYELWDSMQCAA